MLAFSNDYYELIFRATQSVELFCTYDVSALVSRMVIAVLLSLIHINEQSSQIICIGRCADLVIDHTDSIVRLADIQHGLDKVLTIQTKLPCNADNEILLQYILGTVFHEIRNNLNILFFNDSNSGVRPKIKIKSILGTIKQITPLIINFIKLELRTIILESV